MSEQAEGTGEKLRCVHVFSDGGGVCGNYDFTPIHDMNAKTCPDFSIHHPFTPAPAEAPAERPCCPRCGTPRIALLDGESTWICKTLGHTFTFAPQPAEPTSTTPWRCDASFTDRGNEHATYYCTKDPAHTDSHTDGEASWTDAEHYDRATTEQTGSAAVSGERLAELIAHMTPIEFQGWNELLPNTYHSHESMALDILAALRELQTARETIVGVSDVNKV